AHELEQLGRRPPAGPQAAHHPAQQAAELAQLVAVGYHRVTIIESEERGGESTDVWITWTPSRPPGLPGPRAARRPPAALPGAPRPRAAEGEGAAGAPRQRAGAAPAGLTKASKGRWQRAWPSAAA